MADPDTLALLQEHPCPWTWDGENQQVVDRDGGPIFDLIGRPHADALGQMIADGVSLAMELASATKVPLRMLSGRDSR